MAGQQDYIASVCMFAGNFNPLGWLFCKGQLLAISQFDVLFSLIGTIYGGDGQQTFQLPDLQGRAPVGAGQSPGTSFYELGRKGGTEIVELSILQMPAHTHSATFTPSGGGDYSGTVALPVKTGLGAGGNNPNGKYLGTSGNANIYFDAPTDGSNMAAADVTISGSGGGGTIALQNAGGSQFFEILQPYLALNFIICNEGVYPSRN